MHIPNLPEDFLDMFEDRPYCRTCVEIERGRQKRKAEERVASRTQASVVAPLSPVPHVGGTGAGASVMAPEKSSVALVAKTKTKPEVTEQDLTDEVKERRTVFEMKQKETRVESLVKQLKTDKDMVRSMGLLYCNTYLAVALEDTSFCWTIRRCVSARH